MGFFDFLNNLLRPKSKRQPVTITPSKTRERHTQVLIDDYPEKEPAPLPECSICGAPLGGFNRFKCPECGGLFCHEHRLHSHPKQKEQRFATENTEHICATCGKKLGGFDKTRCRVCGDFFCHSHRLHGMHNEKATEDLEHIDLKCSVCKNKINALNTRCPECWQLLCTTHMPKAKHNCDKKKTPRIGKQGDKYKDGTIVWDYSRNAQLPDE